MLTYRDKIKFLASAPGTGNLTPSSTVPGFKSLAGQPNGTYSYHAEEGTSWERGWGYWNGTSLARVIVHETSAGNGSLLNFTGSVTVALVIGAPDLRLIEQDIWYGG